MIQAMIKPILPMLATPAEPFDSYEYLFEIKWDGIRALAAVEGEHWRLWGRDLADYDQRYPELDVLRCLPSGTIVDGELVLFQEGRPDLNALLGRHQLGSVFHIRQASRQRPVRYVLFDTLYHQGRELIREPFHQRRRILADMLLKLQNSAPELIFSEGIAGSGKQLFERVTTCGHEGVMAKLQTSRYLPGKRSPAWKKIKPRQILPCAIIGYTPSRYGLHSVLVATAHTGSLHYVAELTTGFSDLMRRELGRLLKQRRRARPVVPCPHRALWVEPDLHCKVQFFAWTPHGRLRHAVFRGLIENPSQSDIASRVPSLGKQRT